MSDPEPRKLDVGHELPESGVRSASLSDIVSKESREPMPVVLQRMKLRFLSNLTVLAMLAVFGAAACAFLVYAYCSSGDVNLHRQIITGATGAAASLIGALLGRVVKIHDDPS